MIGTVIYGFCNGFFGSGDYSDKEIILEGKTWILCKYMGTDVVTCTNFDSEESKAYYVEKWSSPETIGE